MMKTTLKLAIWLWVTAGCISCGKNDDTTDNVPPCIVDKIQEIELALVWNPPAEIWSYRYKGETVYYIPPRAYDIPSILMNERCQVICNPSGGITGKGDGRCTDFFEKRTNEKLIWKDERTY
jgi:hypothetical protein